ncbi:MAG TPA: hypothetical protein VFE86_13185, partial [Ilumatobacteraceae bacterium]|nr:hypothetical protein [Ilumatobacteraceae bacterium]
VVTIDDGGTVGDASVTLNEVNGPTLTPVQTLNASNNAGTTYKFTGLVPGTIYRVDASHNTTISSGSGSGSPTTHTGHSPNFHLDPGESGAVTVNVS